MLSPYSYDPQNPYPWYQYMRTQNPIFYSQQDRSWHVFRYADVHTVMTQPWLFSSEIPLPDKMPRIITLMDDPKHRQLRSLVAQAFTPHRVDKLAPRIRFLVEELLTPVLPTGQMDVVADLSDPLPVLVIAELLGVPAQDHSQFRAWTHDIASAPPLEAVSRGKDLHHYFRNIIAKRRQAPQDDLISALLAAQIEGRHLTENELLGFCQVLLVAGSETVTHLIANALRCFDEYPGVWQRLRQEPGLLSSAIEEVLRYYAPQSRSIRIAQEDTWLAETHIRTGDYLTIWMASANRDEQQFPHANYFKLDRFPQPTSADHLALGAGGHFCLGAPLGRLEARIALATLLASIKEIQLKDIQCEMASGLVYGPRHLPIIFKRA